MNNMKKCKDFSHQLPILTSMKNLLMMTLVGEKSLTGMKKWHIKSIWKEREARLNICNKNKSLNKKKSRKPRLV